MKTIKNWIFNLRVSGYGDTPEEAWAEALETFFENIHEYLDETDVPDYERYENGDLLEDDEES